MLKYIFTIILFALLFSVIWWFWNKDTTTQKSEKIITDITQENQTTTQIKLTPSNSPKPSEKNISEEASTETKRPKLSLNKLFQLNKEPEITIKNTSDGLLIQSINNQEINRFITKNKVDSYKVEGSIIKFIETKNGSKKIKYFNLTELE